MDDYDYGQPNRKPMKVNGYDDFKDKPNIKNRNVAARYADNPILDEAESTSHMDALHGFLNDGGIDDDEIMRGVRLQTTAMQRVAARLGVGLGEIKTLLNSLIQKLRDEHRAMEEDYANDGEAAAPAESHPRYSYEPDYMDNVTISDSQTGRSVFLQGSEGADFLAQIEQAGDDEDAAQRLMGHYEEVMEGVGEDTDPFEEELTESSSPDSYDTEIASSGGSYNFPWALGDQNGFGSLAYRDGDDKMMVKLISVTDANGDPIKLDPASLAKVKDQAIKFVSQV